MNSNRWFLLCLFLLLLVNLVNLVSAQNNPVNPTSQVNTFEKMVVKEHFLTKKEIKDYMDKKSVEYMRFTDGVIANSFVEIERLTTAKINSLIFKLVIALIGVVFFVQSLFFYVRMKLLRRLKKIEDLKEETNIVKIEDLFNRMVLFSKSLETLNETFNPYNFEPFKDEENKLLKPVVKEEKTGLFKKLFSKKSKDKKIIPPKKPVVISKAELLKMGVVVKEDSKEESSNDDLNITYGED